MKKAVLKKILVYLILKKLLAVNIYIKDNIHTYCNPSFSCIASSILRQLQIRLWSSRNWTWVSRIEVVERVQSLMNP